MYFNGWNNFEDLARACGYTNCDKDNHNASKTSNDNGENNFSNMGCSDIPNGFQSLDPQLFVIIGEILGNIVAGSIPYNVQNAAGNWLELVGQAILTYNAQQQYFQGGPGRYFDPKNYNVNNSSCTTTPQNTTQNNSSNNERKSSNKSNRKDSNNAYSKKTSDENEVCEIDEIESRINELKYEIERIKNKMEK